jgi:hypothetical protein
MQSLVALAPTGSKCIKNKQTNFLLSIYRFYVTLSITVFFYWKWYKIGGTYQIDDIDIGVVWCSAAFYAKESVRNKKTQRVLYARCKISNMIKQSKTSIENFV